MTLAQWINNSKKAIVAGAAPLVTVWIMQLAEQYGVDVPPALLSVGVTVLLMVAFGLMAYYAKNIPPGLQDAIMDAVDGDEQKTD